MPSSGPKRVVVRLLLAVLLAAGVTTLSLYLTLTSTRFEERLRKRLLAYAADAAGPDVRIDALELEPLKLIAVLRGVSAEPPEGGQIRARRIEVRLDPWSLFAADPQVDMLRLEDALVDLDLAKLPWHPKPGERVVRLPLPRHVIFAGTELKLRSGDLSAGVAALTGDVLYENGEVRASLGFDVTALSLDRRELAPGKLKLEARLVPNEKLVLDRLAGDLRTGAVDLRGTVDLRESVFDLRGRATVETAALAAILRAPGIAAGPVTVVGRVVGPTLSPRFLGTVDADEVRVKGLPFRTIRGELAVGRRGLTLNAGTADLFDGDVAFRGRVPFPAHFAEVTFRATDADLSQTPAVVPGFPFVHGKASAEGMLRVGGPEGLIIEAPVRFTGLETELIAGVTDPRFRLLFSPADGTAQVRLEGGEIKVTEGLANSAWAALRVSGTVRPGGAMALDLDLDGADLRDVAKLELPAPPWRSEPLTYRLIGRTTGLLTLRGTTPSPEFHAEASAPGVLLQGPEGIRETSVAFASARATLDYAEHHLRWEASAAGLSAADPARVHASGEVVLADKLVAPLQSVALESTGWDAARLARLADLPLEASGRASLEAELSIDRTGASGTLGGTLSGTLAGLPVEVRGARVRLDPAHTSLESLDASVAGSRVAASGLLRGSDDAIGLDLAIEGVQLAALAPTAAAVVKGGVEGSLAIEAHVSGASSAPRIEGQVHVRGLGVGVGRFGDLDGTIHGDRDEVRLVLGRDDLDVDVHVASRGSWPFEAKATFRDLALAPFATLLFPGAMVETTGAASGSLSASGTVSPVLTLGEGRLSVSAAHAAVGGLEVAAAPFEARLVGPSVVSVSGLRLSGPESELRVEGRVGLGKEASDLRIEGSTDLRLLRAFVRDVAVSGPLKLDVRLRGTTGAPRMEGTASLEEGYFRTPALPYPLRDVAGRVVFVGSTATVPDLRARFGGGQIQAEGTIDMSNPEAPALKLHATGEDVRLTFADLEVRANPDLTYELTPAGRSIAGTLRVTRATYSARGGLPTAFGRRPGLGEKTEIGGFPETRLALRLIADGNLWLLSSDARIQADAALTINGTTAEPVLLGRVSYLSQEKLELQGRRYRIVRGSLVFDNPAEIDPRLDVLVETESQGIRVTLQVTGPLSSPQVNARSDPPLPQSDVFSLLIGGRPRGDTGVAGPGGEEVLRSLFLPRAIARLTGGYFTVDVSALQGRADPTEVLPIAIRPAEHIAVILGVPLREARPGLFIVNWRPFDTVSFSATRDLDRSLGLEAGWEKRFGSSASGPNEEPRVASVRVVGAPPPLEARLAERVKTTADKRLSRDRLRQDVDRLVATLRDAGYPLARVQAAVEPVAAGPDPPAIATPAGHGEKGASARVVFTVEPGAPVKIELQGIPRSKSLDASLAETVQSFGLYGETTSELERTTRATLAEQGFARSVVSCERADDEGVRILCEVDPGERYRIGSISFVGNEHVSHDRLAAVLRTRTGAFRKARLVTAQVEDDTEAIRILYADLGYLRATARAEVRDTKDPFALGLVFYVSEGPLYQVERVRIEGSSSVPEARLRHAMKVEPGDPLAQDAIRAERDALFRVYDDLGYMDASVRVEHHEIPPEGSGKSDLVFRVTEGTIARVRAIRIEGARRTKETIIRRALHFEPGSLIGYRRVSKSQRALYDLGIFRSVDIAAIPADDDPEHRDVVVRVEEAAPYRLQLGGGFDSKQGIRGLVEIADANFTGRARYLGLQLRAAGDSSRAQILFREPRPFGLNLPSFLTTFYEQRHEVSFDLKRTAFRLESARALDARERSRVLFRYNLSDTKLSNLQVSTLEAGAEDVRISSLGAALARDTRDDVLEPRKGYLASADVEWADSVLGSQADFTKLTLKAYRYQALRPRLVWAAAAQVGLGFPRGGDSLPLAERYFSGGATSLRGFGYNEAGPRDPLTNEPTGGNAVLVLNQEIRYDLFRRLIGSVFVDAGNVYRGVSDIGSGEIRWSAGVGLRYRGPIVAGIDYARLLRRNAGEKSYQVHFSLGYAF